MPSACALEHATRACQRMYDKVATAEGVLAVTKPAGRQLRLPALAALTIAAAALASVLLLRRLFMAASEDEEIPGAALTAAAAATCWFANRSFGLGAIVDAPPLASRCRPCTCAHGEWRCCTLRPAAHSIARGTERYAETLAFVAAWMHLKREGVAPGRTYRDNALMQWLMQHGLWFHQVHRSSWLLPWHRQYLYEVGRLTLTASRAPIVRVRALPVSALEGALPGEVLPHRTLGGAAATRGVGGDSWRRRTAGGVRLAHIAGRRARLGRAPRRCRRRDFLHRATARDVRGHPLLAPPARRSPPASRRADGGLRPAHLWWLRAGPRGWLRQRVSVWPAHVHGRGLGPAAGEVAERQGARGVVGQPGALPSPAV